MAKWCICNIKGSPLRVWSTYEAEENQQANYGGPWGDPTQYQHIEVPEELLEENIMNLVPFLCEKQTGVQKIQSIKPLFDSEGNPILAEDGTQRQGYDVDEIPIMSAAWKLKKKNIG